MGLPTIYLPARIAVRDIYGQRQNFPESLQRNGSIERPLIRRKVPRPLCQDTHQMEIYSGKSSMVGWILGKDGEDCEGVSS